MDEIEQWAAALDVLMIRIGLRFARSEAKARAKDRLKSLLRPTERQNGRQLAETVGDATPYGFQQLLCRSPWNPNDVRDDLRDCVIKPFGDDDAVLVVDDTGFLKEGAQSVGVARQYSGAAGRIATGQVGVFLAYASWRGAALSTAGCIRPSVGPTTERGVGQSASPPLNHSRPSHKAKSVSTTTKRARGRDGIAASHWRVGRPHSWR